MAPKAASVSAYLASLPADRRAALEAVREVILANLDEGYEEGIQYGMIGYYVPHRLYPAGYHCDPKQPLPFASIAAQKSHMAIYLMCLYMQSAGELGAWFQQAWAKSGKKLDMGKSCIRFKKLDDLALDVLGETIRRVPAATYIREYEAARAASGGAKKKTAAKATPAKAAAAKTAPAKKVAAKKVAAKKVAPRKSA